MSNVVVVDASVVIKWVINGPDSSTARMLLADWTKREVVILAPTLLAYEANNTLYKYIRAGQISYEDVERGLEQVIFPAIDLDFSEEIALTIRALGLARQFELPATYDAQYLALAEHKSCELWTPDTRMWRMVKEHLSWVRCLADYHPHTSV
jgi:predicted nucleic acid-binding protein